ncbi:MAG TPA: hypothetical protein VGI89_07315, partial [Rhizomicrobium sp.]
MRRAKIQFAAAIAAVALLLVSAAAQAATIVTPNAAAGAESVGNNIIPFSYTSLVARYQQSVAAIEFSSVSGPVLITSLAFRRDGDFTTPTSAFNFTWSNVAVGLSTIHDPLTTSLDNNRGADFQNVFSGALTVS